MNPRPIAGLACLLIGAAALAGCSPVRNDGHMFERWADSVAQIPIDEGARPSERRADVAPTADRPAATPMKIDLIDHTGPDSRAAGLRAAVAIVDSEIAGLKRRIVPDAPQSPAETSASGQDQPAAPRAPAGFVAQLAAYPTRRGAEAAWSRLKAAHAEVFAKVSPRFEPVDLGARGVWTRLQAGPLPSREQAQALCAEAGVTDRWCVSPDRG